ncbi:hypothetical protein FQV39_21215 [Bosea sp. F3-2]|nr:hypothetical protein FQV39_21215 [Bosea sp. F3-2]
MGQPYRRSFFKRSLVVLAIDSRSTSKCCAKARRGPTALALASQDIDAVTKERVESCLFDTGKRLQPSRLPQGLQICCVTEYAASRQARTSVPTISIAISRINSGRMP